VNQSTHSVQSCSLLRLNQVAVFTTHRNCFYTRLDDSGTIVAHFLQDEIRRFVNHKPLSTTTVVSNRPLNYFESIDTMKSSSTGGLYTFSMVTMMYVMTIND